MRVTQFTQYNNFILNQQRTLSELNKVQMEISTGTKIQNMYDDAAVFTKHLKLTEEINSLTQVKSSATFAQTFANETDTVMNDFVSTLGTFKTNLLNAANATNDETSRNAIVSELKGLLEHLKDLANTSINGKYLFSGSRFDTKPIDDNFEYQGNSENVKAFLGAGVEREYNIDGASLFLGRDNDYSKHISTNVVQYDKMKANPEFVVRGADGNLYIDKTIPYPDEPGAVSINEPISGDSQIRQLTGVEDIKLDETDYEKIYQEYKYNNTVGVNYNSVGVDGNELVIENFFFEGTKEDTLIDPDNPDKRMKDNFNLIHFTGKDTDGNDIDTFLKVNGDTKMKDLTSRIQEIYGDVSVSFEDGKIHITDNSSENKKLLDVSFTTQNTTDKTSEDTFSSDGDTFTSVSNFYTDNTSDTLYSLLGSQDSNGNTFNKIHLTGTDTDGNNVDVVLNVDDQTELQDLIDEIQNAYGDVSVSLENNKIVVKDNSGNGNLSLDMTTQSDSTPIEMLDVGDPSTTDSIPSNYDSYIIDNAFFDTDDTKAKLKDILSTEAKTVDGDETRDFNLIHLSGTDTNGANVDVDLSVDNTTTLEDLMNKIKDTYGDVDVQFYDGKIKVTANSGKENLKVVMTGYYDTNNDGLDTGTDKRLKIFEKYSVKNKYKDGISYFYVKGKKPGGELVDEKFALKNSDSVNNLLEKIGKIYGNTPTSKVVDVSLNDMGEIQIKDIESGKMLTDFYMVASDKDEPSIEDLVKNGDYIVEFQKSNFNSIRNLSTIQSNHDYFDNRITKFGSAFKTIDTKREALPSDKLYNVLGEKGIRDSDGTIQKFDHLTLSGVDADGFEVEPFDLSVDENTTMQDLMDQIKDHFGDVSVNLENGELIIHDNSIPNPTDISNLKIKIGAYDADDESLQVFASKDIANFQKLYMDKSGNEIKGNVSNFGNDYKVILKNGERITEKNEMSQQYVTDNALLSDSILYKSSKTDKVRDIFGNDISSITLKQDDGTSVNITVDGNTTFQDIIDNSNGLITGYSDGVFSTKQNVSITYKNDSGDILKDIGYEKLNIDYMDLDGNYKKALIILRDQPYIDENNNKHYSTFWIDNNNDGNIDNDEVYDIFEPDGSLTPAHDTITTTVEMDKNTCTACKKEKLQKGMTYRQLGDVISMLTSGNLPANKTADDYNEAVNKAKEEITTGMDEKGRFYLKDKSNNPTKIDLSIYTDNNSLYFQANNAITVDEPQVDFFDTLQKAIDAVKNGNNYPDSEKNPRNFGIQGAIEAIDHVTDHVRRLHAKIGAVSNEFSLTIERTEMLTLNVQQLQSENIDTDLGEATMKLNSLQVSYQALLASIAKVNKLTLLNYL